MGRDLLDADQRRRPHVEELPATDVETLNVFRDRKTDWVRAIVMKQYHRLHGRTMTPPGEDGLRHHHRTGRARVGVQEVPTEQRSRETEATSGG